MKTLSLQGRSRPLAMVWLLSAVMLSGCSMPRLAYNQADWLVLQQLDSYLDLTDLQESRAEEALAAAHRRHRQSVLPGFADALADAAARVRTGITQTDVRDFMDTARTLLAASLDEILPTVVEALAGLPQEQQAHLTKRFVENNEKYADRHGLDRPREERLERRAERTVTRIEDWTGPLSSEQITLVHGLRNDMPDSATLWLEHRRSRQRALMALISGGASTADLDAFLRDWWLMKDDLPASLAQLRERQTEGYITLIARLAATLDSVQRSHLAHRLEDLARDARELAAAT